MCVCAVEKKSPPHWLRLNMPLLPLLHVGKRRVCLSFERGGSPPGQVSLQSSQIQIDPRQVKWWQVEQVCVHKEMREYEMLEEGRLIEPPQKVFPQNTHKMFPWVGSQPRQGRAKAKRKSLSKTGRSRKEEGKSQTGGEGRQRKGW